jgi:hypothetical protein
MVMVVTSTHNMETASATAETDRTSLPDFVGVPNQGRVASHQERLAHHQERVAHQEVEDVHAGTEIEEESTEKFTTY